MILKFEGSQEGLTAEQLVFMEVKSSTLFLKVCGVTGCAQESHI